MDAQWSMVIRAFGLSAKTPFYLFRSEVITNNLAAFQRALKIRNRQVGFYYSIKTNPAKEIVCIVQRQGWGFLASSMRDLKLASRSRATSVVYDAPLKSSGEFRLAKDNIDAFIVCENQTDLHNTVKRAKRAAGTKIGLRVMIPESISRRASRFGFDLCSIEQVYGVLRELPPNSRLESLHFHLGNNQPSPQCFYELACFAGHAWKMFHEAGYPVQVIDLGGGIPCSQPAKQWRRYAHAVESGLADVPAYVSVFFEPGRAIVEDAAILCVQVKDISVREGKTYVLVDGGSDAVMPSWMRNEPRQITKLANESSSDPSVVSEAFVVGPLCSEGDVLGTIQDPTGIRVGDLLVIHHVGAYDWSTKFEFGVSAPQAFVARKGDRLARFR